MGAKITAPSSNFNYKSVENTHKQNQCTVEVYEKHEYLGTFNSITLAANYLKVRRECVYGKFKTSDTETIYHRKPKRTITYKLIK